MRPASTIYSCCPFAFGSWAATCHHQKKLTSQIFPARSSSCYRPISILCSVKASAGADFGFQTKFSTLWHDLTCQFLESSPHVLKDFAWKKAEMMVKEHLTALRHDVAKWSLVTLLVYNFVSDILMAISTSRELFVPLGLFIGVMVADFMKEFCSEFFEIREKGGTNMQQLWGIGWLFVAFRFVFLYFRISGWMLLSYITNGGLMQILWLAYKQ